MNKLFVAGLVLLASCDSSDESGNQQAGRAPGQAPQAAGEGDRDKGRGGSVTDLAGLYEGSGEPRHQMCVVEGKGGEERFGLIVWGANQHSCSGAGTVSREGDKLRLAMAGDSECTIEATISGKTVKLPSSVPQGCAYYCGARASLGGAELTQQGTTKEAAMRAKDLVGEPLCAGEEG